MVHTMSDGEFSVFQFFSNGEQEEVARHVDAATAVRMAKSLTKSIGGAIGTTRRVVITDGQDFTTFEWKFGEGVVFPPGLPRKFPGYTGLHVRDEAPGALPNGTRVRKVASDPADKHRNGDLGTVLGSMSAPLVGVGYFVEWDDSPRQAVFIAGDRVSTNG
jgi:hypothetical protein